MTVPNVTIHSTKQEFRHDRTCSGHPRGPMNTASASLKRYDPPLLPGRPPEQPYYPRNQTEPGGTPQTRPVAMRHAGPLTAPATPPPNARPLRNNVLTVELDRPSMRPCARSSVPRPKPGPASWPHSPRRSPATACACSPGATLAATRSTSQAASASPVRRASSWCSRRTARQYGSATGLMAASPASSSSPRSTTPPRRTPQRTIRFPAALA